MKHTQSSSISAIPRPKTQGLGGGHVPMLAESEAESRGQGERSYNVFNANAPMFVPNHALTKSPARVEAVVGHSPLVYYIELLNLHAIATRSELEKLVKNLCFKITKNSVVCFEIVNFGVFEPDPPNKLSFENKPVQARSEGEFEQLSDLQVFATVGVTRWDVFSSLLWTLDGYEWGGQLISAQMGALRDGSRPEIDIMHGGAFQHEVHGPEPIHSVSPGFPLGSFGVDEMGPLHPQQQHSKIPQSGFASPSSRVVPPFDLHYTLPMGIPPLYYGCSTGYNGMFAPGFHLGTPQNKRQNQNKDMRGTRTPHRHSASLLKDEERTRIKVGEPERSSDVKEHADTREDSFIVIEGEEGSGPIKVDPCRLFVGNVPFRLTWAALRSFLVDQSTKKDPESVISIQKVKIPMQQIVYNCYGQMIGNGYDSFVRDMYMREMRSGWDVESIQAMLALVPLYNLSKSKGYAIVQTGDAVLARKLIEMFDNVDFEGRSLTVRYDRFPLVDSYVLQLVSTGIRRPPGFRWTSDDNNAKWSHDRKDVKDAKRSGNAKEAKWNANANDAKCGADGEEAEWGSDAKDEKWGFNTKEERKWGANTNGGRSINTNAASDPKTTECNEPIKHRAKTTELGDAKSASNPIPENTRSMDGTIHSSNEVFKKTRSPRKIIATDEWTVVEKKVRDRAPK